MKTGMSGALDPPSPATRKSSRDFACGGVIPSDAVRGADGSNGRDRESRWRPGGGLGAIPVILLAACCGALLPACKRADAPKPAAEVHPLAHQLAGARLDAAKAALEKDRKAEAVLLLVASLEADPGFSDSFSLLRDLLAETRWPYPVARLDAGIPVDHFTGHGNSLWMSVTEPEGFTTAARWNLETLAIESVMFPRKHEKTKSLALSPDGKRLIVRRGPEGRTLALLCDAATLQPMTDLESSGNQAEVFTAFSSDGLLMGHPQMKDGSLVWHIRDLASGQILRSHPLSAMPAVAAATLDRESLKLSRADGTTTKIPVNPTTPVETSNRAPKVAVAEAATMAESEISFIARGTTVEMRRLLGLPKTTGRGAGKVRFDAALLPTLSRLAVALTGLRFDGETRTFSPITETDRREALSECRAEDWASLVEGLDFTEVVKGILDSPFRASAPDAGFPIRDRIRRAAEDEPRYLALDAATPPEETPEEKIRKALTGGDEETGLAAIKALPKGSPTLATAMLVSLESEHPSWIAACIQSAEKVPPLLDRLAASRSAWLEKRRPDAIGLWQGGFPNLVKSQSTEDWNGWEAVDFTPFVNTHIGEIRKELANYELAENATPIERTKLIRRLLDANTTRAIGKHRHATACLSMAQSAEGSEEILKAIELCQMARVLGAPYDECLRTEAAAYTRLGNFAKAHETWVSLLDEPVETHRPEDYAEAAYTAFEIGNGDHAMEILAMGISRYPEDGNFAYRAGWIALLTERWESAHRFLIAGDRVGFPNEKFPKALAMLAIAAAEIGESEEAYAYFNELEQLDPTWAEPAPPQIADWPVELQATLRGFVEPPKALPVE